MPHHRRSALAYREGAGGQERGGMRRTRLALLPMLLLPVLPAAACSGAGTPAPERTHVYTPGAATAGDSLFPDEGNGGYDATHYALAISYDPKTLRLTGDD